MATEKGEQCGAFGCRPSWIQRFATPSGFLLIYGLLGTTQTMAYLYFIATLTTMERRFKIPSQTTGIMLCGNEISQILLSLLLTYFGGSGNRPRWIAWGVATSALSCFILVLPQLIYGPGNEALALTVEYRESESLPPSPTMESQWNIVNASFEEFIESKNNARTSSVTTICSIDAETSFNTNDTIDKCDGENTVTEDGSYSMVPIFIVFLSQFVLGIGTTLYYALGQIYMDDNAEKKNTPKLLGMTLALRTLGPALGFLLGFACLKLYVDPNLTPVIDKQDPRWIGAWWLGWIVLGIVMLFFAVLIAMFPKKLPIRSKLKAIRGGIEAADALIPKHLEHPKPTMKEFPVALKRLLKNKLLMFNIMSTVFYILGAAGYITFSTKYLEVQYNQSAAGASMVAGVIGMLAMVMGFLVSGLVISKFKPAPKYLLFWNVIAGTMYMLSEIMFIFLGCPDVKLQGAGAPGEALQLITSCNDDCSCPQDLHYSPVCVGDTTFYSPCHAGCSVQQDTSVVGRNMTFSNCQCAMEAMSNLTAIDISSVIATDGTCVPSCENMMLIFIILTFFMHVIGSSARIGNILVNYRCVEPKDKAFAQGLALVLVSLLAFIPGPIIFGAIIDSTCIVWERACGKKGNCSLYDRTKFRVKMNATASGITLLAVLLDIVVWRLGFNLKLYDETEENSYNTGNQNELKTRPIYTRPQSTNQNRNNTANQNELKTCPMYYSSSINQPTYHQRDDSHY